MENLIITAIACMLVAGVVLFAALLVFGYVFLSASVLRDRVSFAIAQWNVMLPQRRQAMLVFAIAVASILAYLAVFQPTGHP